MKPPAVSRRGVLKAAGAILGGLLLQPVARAAKSVVKKVLVSSSAPPGYDPYKHKWLMCVDAERCIGCGVCVAGCPSDAVTLERLPEARISLPPTDVAAWGEERLRRRLST